jgi:hypothetical protein
MLKLIMSTTGRGSGCCLQRLVSLLFWFSDMLTPCRGYLCFEDGTRAGKSLPASGLGEGANNPRPTIVCCPNRQDRCKRCAWLHALGKLATSDASKRQKYAFVNRIETDHRNRDGNAAQIRDLNPETKLLSGIGLNNGNGVDSDTQPVVSDGSPSIDDAENGAKKPENQTCDSRDERNVLHGAKQANVES